MDEHKSCKDRIKAELKDRIIDLHKLYALECEGKEEGDEKLGSLWDYGLSFDYVAQGTFENQKEGYFRYQLSWGGPSDEFRIFTGPEFIPHCIEYWFLDWGDGANIKLSGQNLELITNIFEMLKECGTVQEKFEESTEG